MSDLGLDCGRVCRVPPHGYALGLPALSEVLPPTIHALAVRLLRLKPEPKLLAHHCGQEAAHRMRLPAGGAHDSGDAGAAGPAQQCKHSRLFRIRSRLIMVGNLSSRGRRPDFGGRLPLASSRTLALGHTETPLNRVGAIAPPPPNPAEAHRRWRGRGASRSGSVFVATHTLSLRAKSSAK